MPYPRPRVSGFTLIELMLVIAMICLVSAVGMPTFSHLVAKSHESVTKGNQASIRAALSIYFGDTDGKYPGIYNQLTELTEDGKYLKSIPFVYLPRTAGNTGHASSNYVLGTGYDEGTYATTQEGAIQSYDQGLLGGGWAYNVNLDIPGQVAIYPNCMHQDMRGMKWVDF